MQALNRMNRWLGILLGAQLVFDIVVLLYVWQQTIWNSRVTELLVNAGMM